MREQALGEGAGVRLVMNPNGVVPLLVLDGTPIIDGHLALPGRNVRGR
jgi:hypothetical protein